MGKKASTITLTPEERSILELQTRSRIIQAQTVCRARILLFKADGESIDVIADKVGLNRCSVMLCLRYLNSYKWSNQSEKKPFTNRCKHRTYKK